MEVFQWKWKGYGAKPRYESYRITLFLTLYPASITDMPFQVALLLISARFKVYQ